MPDSEDLASELHSALAHLDDPPYLERHPLASRFGFIAQEPEPSRGQALRRVLRLAIAALDPGAGTATGALEARSYQVLYRWAVSRQSMSAIADLLGISKRQAYRELRLATQALAQVLAGASAGSDLGPPTAGAQAAHVAPQVHEELERLAQVTDQDVDLGDLLKDVVQSARYLARPSGIDIQLRVDEPDLCVAANRVMLRQAILNLLSHIVGLHPRRLIDVHLSRSNASATVHISFRPQELGELSHPASPYAVATQLFGSLGLTWLREEAPGGTTRFAIGIPLVQEHTVLIVDDNEGLIALLKRYLRHQPYRVHGASHAGQALQMLEQLKPDVVILDVMMPDRDGWEVLRTLRATEAGRRARVIICSIINDPKLAIALGADAFLNKPVDRAGILQALASVTPDA